MKSAPTPELTSLQTRKRAAILEGAKTVFLREGFGAATMDDVAAAAGVGKQTVYRHFGSKEALFLGLYRSIVAEAGRLPVLGAIFYQHGPQLARSMAARILTKRFDEKTAAARASTFVALVLGDVHLEMTLGYEVPDFKARFKKQIEEAIQASLR